MLSMFTQVYSIEKLFRKLYQEVIEKEVIEIKEHLRQELNQKTFNEVLRRTVEGQPLSGLEFKQLIDLFVKEDRWEIKKDPEKSTGTVFEKGPLIKILKTKRETVECFLDDVRRIRNHIVHYKPLTTIHREMLRIYYSALIEPIRIAYPNQTKVDVRLYEQPSSTDLNDYRNDVRRFDSELKKVKRLSQVSLAILVALAVASLPLILPRLHDKLDPARHDVELANTSPEKIGAIVTKYCANGQIEVVERIAQLPAAANSMSNRISDSSQILLLQLAAAYPNRLAECVPSLSKLGWNPDTLSRTTVGNDFDSNNNLLGSGIPEAYQSYLRKNGHGLNLNGYQVEATELHGNALLYAVWHENLNLIKALLAIGSNPRLRYTVDGMWIGQNEAVPVFSAMDEAIRLGNRDIIELLKNTRL